MAKRETLAEAEARLFSTTNDALDRIRPLTAPRPSERQALPTSNVALRRISHDFDRRKCPIEFLQPTAGYLG